MTGRPEPSFWRGRRVTVTGAAGFVGRAVVRDLEALDADVRAIHSSEHDLCVPECARDAVAGADTVMHLAARVGGIDFNRRNPAPLVHDNLMMGANIYEASRLAGVRKLVAACSVCAYPEHTPLPFLEDTIWDGYPEGSNAPYGLAKRMLLVLADAYRRQHGLDSCVPVMTNLYGPGDNSDAADSHVVGAMIRKFVEGAMRGDPAVRIWGTGRATREFLYVDDAARALLLCAERLADPAPVNIGTGVETSIRELAMLIRRLSGFEGEIVWDDSYPDGQPARRLRVSRARELIGFESEVALEEGLRRTIAAFRGRRPVVGPAVAAAEHAQARRPGEKVASSSPPR